MGSGQGITEEERQARVAELDLDMANIYKVSCHSWYDLTDQQKSELADLYIKKLLEIHSLRSAANETLPTVRSTVTATTQDPVYCDASAH